MLPTETYGNFQKIKLPKVPTNPSISLNCFRIVIPSPSNLKKPNEPFLESLDRNFSALLKVSVEVLLLLVPKYIKEYL